MSISVLVADDEIATRNILKDYLPWEELGVKEVFVADDGAAALQITKEVHPKIIISDIKMPHMNGIELAGAVREVVPDCKFIFLSGYPDKEFLMDAIKLRAVRFVEKPIDLAEITSLLAEQIRECKKSVVNDAVHQFFLEKDSDKELNDEVYAFPNLELNILRQMITERKQQESQRILEQLFVSIGNAQGTDIKYIRNLFTQIAGIFVAAAENHNIREILGKKDFYLYEVPYALSLMEMRKNMMNLSHIYFEEVSGEKSDLVTRVNNYLIEHYSSTDLIIQDVAADLGFVYTYLCSAYSKACGKTINQQLTKLRIKEAKRLLKYNSLKLYEVAEECGYSDAKYFAKVFLKETGLTPREYRERHCYGDEKAVWENKTQ